MPSWTWILLAMVLLAIEMTAPGGLVALFFAAGAMIVCLLTAVGVGGPAWMQWLTFAVVSVATLAALRRQLRARLAAVPRIDGLVGETAIALQPLASRGHGIAELRGTVWSARNATDRDLEPGQRCRVERVEGLVIWIAPEE